MYDIYPAVHFGGTLPGQGDFEFQFLVDPKTLRLDILGEYRV